MKRPWRRVRSEEGAAAVEAALSCILMLSLLLGIFEMFFALYAYHYVSYAAREGSRWAIVRGYDCASDSATMPNCGAAQSDIQTYIQNLGFPGINSSNVTAAASWYSPSTTQPTTWSLCATGAPGTCNQPGYLVQVAVTYSFPLNLPFISKRTINVKSTSQMVISQ